MAGASWGTAIRLARRNARRSLGRTVLVGVLIGLPMVAAATFAVVVASINPTAEVEARLGYGTADAKVWATEFERLVRAEPSFNGPYSPPIDAQLAHNPATVDIRKLLPAGTTFTTSTDPGMSSVRIRAGESITSYPVNLTGSGPLLDGTYRREEGRLPETAGEVAVTPALAEQLGLLDDGKLIPNASLTTENGRRYTVVGQLKPQWAPLAPQVWAPIDSALAGPQPAVPVYLVKFPDSVDVPQFQEKMAAVGIGVSTRADVGLYGGGFDVGNFVRGGLIVGFGVLEIVLLAGTAFAVGARRQSRELGLVTANGGRPEDIRRMVLAQGLVIGLGGAVSGAALGVGIALIGRPWWENLAAELITAWRIPWAAIAGMIAIGVLAGLASAVVPAIQAGRQTPLAALAGRFEVSTGTARLRRPALALVVIGLVANLFGTSLLAKAMAEVVAEVDAIRATGAFAYGRSAQPMLPLALIIAGAAAVLIGVIWLLPNLVAKAAALGRLLPLAGRLALRDAARHRHRTGPTAAAIMMAVAATAALAIGFANDFAAKEDEYLPMAREGDAVLSYRGDNSVMNLVPYEDRTAIYSTELRDKVAKALPTKAVADIGQLFTTRGDAGLAVFTPVGVAYDQLSVYVVDPAYAESLGGFGPAAAEAMREGKVVLTRRSMIQNGKVRIDHGDATKATKQSRSVPAEAIPFAPPGALRGSALVSPQLAATLGKTQITQTHFQLTREPTKEELKVAAGFTKSVRSLQVEYGYRAPAALAMAGALGVATLVTLLGVAVAVSLSAAEGRADLATLAAVGAQPKRRRNFAAAQAWLLGQIGCLLGVGIGALLGYTTRTLTRSPYFAVPWLQLLGIVVLVPLFAAGLAWLMTRSRLPMLRRAE